MTPKRADRAVADAIRRLRRRAGLTQRELAARLTERGEGTSRATVANWECGVAMPNARQYLAILAATEVETEDLLEERVRRLERQVQRLLGEADGA